MIVWTAYSRTLGQIVAFVIGKERDCAYELFCEAERAVGNIGRIYTDANTCYKESFAFHNIKAEHIVSPLKTETHLIEATNSSIRDNLARFNRLSKRFTRSLDMLYCSLKLFFTHKRFNQL